MKLLLKIPLTLWYWVLFLIYRNLYLQEGTDALIPSAGIVLPSGAELDVSMTIIFITIGAVLLGFELSRAIRFSPRDNNVDALLSMLIGVVYAVMFLFYPFWAHELFFTYVVFAAIDVLVGLLAILGVSRRSFEYNR